MTQEQRSNSKLLWGLVTAIILVIILFFTFQWLNSGSSSALKTDIPSPTFTTTQEAASAAKAAETEKPSVELEAVDIAAASEVPALSAPVKLVDDNILKMPVPQDEALAKEEVSKLEDIQSQLVDQEKSLQDQHATADDLIKLKEEQIALLEAQLAQQS